jgi:cell migration-inducing and hyaluronan-binding protein
MRKQSRLFLYTHLVPASLLLATGAGVAAQDNENHANMAMGVSAPAAITRTVKWSDPSAWPSGKVPAADEAVTIPRDTEVMLDVSPPELRSLTVQGKLTFADERDLALTTDWIYVPGGELQIGTEASPFQHNATITLTDKVPGENINTMGDRGIMVLGGTLNLHGTTDHTWTKLAATAGRGATSIEVLDASEWRAGEEIVLASTDFNPRQAERRTITSVSGNTLSFAEPLQYMHYGEITLDVDERGEVAMINRNIRIEASEDAAASHFGGHIMAMGGSKMYVDSIELNRMGQHLTLARYPIHFHVLGEGAGMYVRNAAIHDTYNRCVTVHGTNDLMVENNVTFNTVGHCFFMEDGIEHGNQFVHNLAIQTKCHPTLACVPTNLAANGENNYTYANRMTVREISFHGGGTLLPSDNTAASFWITNPDNSYIDNVAAGSDETGFWLSLPEHPNGAFLNSEASAQTWPRRTPLRAFRGNVSHSNFDGFLFDRNINVDNTFGLAGNAFMPRVNPADPSSAFVETHFENLTSYKNRNGGLWGRGELFVFRNLKLADNAIGMTISSGDFGSQRFTSQLVDSLVVGETDNVGNPTTPDEVAYGRSLPKPPIPDFPIRGYEYYDYRVDVVNTTFVNYQDNPRRKTGALSWLLFTSSGVTTANTASGLRFVNAKPVYFPNITSRFDNDNRGGVAYRTLSIHDLDGSVTGIPDSHIMLNDGENDTVVTDDSCEIHPTWNASVCRGDVGRLYLSERRPVSRIGAPAALAAPAAPGAPAAPTAPAAPPAAVAQAAPPAPEKPIALVRNGREFHITGSQSTVRAGTEVEVKTERPVVTLSLSEMDQGSWVVFKLPGFTNAASGTAQRSLAALRRARETSYFRDGGDLWIKLVVTEPPVMPIRPLDIQASIAVSR